MSSNLTEVAVRISEELAQPLIVSSLHGERFVSESLNRKMSGIFEAGIVAGFEPELAGGMIVRVTSKSAKNGLGAALVDNSELTAVTVRQLSDVQVVIPATGVSIVVVEAIYGNIRTRQVDANSNTDAAVVKVVSEKTDTQVELFRVNAPAGTEELTLDMLDLTHRQFSSASPRIAESLEDDPNKLISLELLNSLIATGELGGGSGSFYVPEIIPVTADSSTLTYQLNYPVGFLVVNAEFQRPGAAYDFTVDEKTKTITFLSGKLEAGDTVSIYHEVVKSNPNARATQSIIWPYNGGLPVDAGINAFYLPFKAASVSMMNISGDMQYSGLHFDYYPEEQIIRLKNGDVTDGGETIIIHTELKAIDALMPNAMQGISFEKGGRLDSVNDHVYFKEKQCWYFWTGGFPKVVPADSNPDITGGVSVGAWVETANNTFIDGLKSKQGAYLPQWERNKVTKAITSAGGYIDTQPVSIYEERFAGLITFKPSENPQSWDWQPAIQAAMDYCVSYMAQTAVNAQMYACKTIKVPAGIHCTKKELKATRFGKSAGSLTTILTIEGEGRSSSLIQPIVEEITALRATSCSLMLKNIGFRAGAKYCFAWELGNLTEWEPAFHCSWESVGASGFAKGLKINHLFDSTFADLFVQEITAMKDGTQASSGIEVSTYLGPKNGGKDGDGSGDNSNQITFIRPTVETAKADNTILLNIIGKSKTLPHHNINIFAGHFETHNLRAKAYNLKNCFNLNLHGVNFSQNGETVDADGNAIVGVSRLGYIEDCWNINFTGGRQQTSSKLDAVGDSDTKIIKITGQSRNIRFMEHHFSTPYFSVAAGARNLDLAFDYSEAALGERAFKLINCTVNDFDYRSVNPELRVTDKQTLRNDFVFTIGDNGRLSISRSTDHTDVIAPSEVAAILTDGIMSASGMQIGSLLAAGTRGVDFLTSASATDVMASVKSDSLGRLYLTSVSGSQQWVFGSASLAPVKAATQSIASSSAPVKDIFSSNAVTVISDERKKSSIEDLSDVEIQCAIECGRLYKKYKLNTAIEEKGEQSARYHIGLIAQDIMKCFTDNGLDWRAYGIVTFEAWGYSPAVINQWDDEYEKAPDFINEDGSITEGESVLIRKAGSEVIRPEIEAGEVYMVRYDEINSFINAGLQHKLDRLEARLDALS